MFNNPKFIKNVKKMFNNPSTLFKYLVPSGEVSSPVTRRVWKSSGRDVSLKVCADMFTIIIPLKMSAVHAFAKKKKKKKKKKTFTF